MACRNSRHWGAMCSKVEGKTGIGLPANTAEETAAKLAEIGGVQLRCYTDGGADGNGAKGVWGAAGWGAHVLLARDGGDTEVKADLWGLVETDADSVWCCGATHGTNNTGELIGIGQALLWLRDVAAHATLSAPEAVTAPAIILFDSTYAANMVTGRWQPNANVALVEWARRLLAQVEAGGREGHFVHVKGHSDDGGNDRADELVQWGKGDGPYARLRNDGGEGESRFGAAANRARGGAADAALPLDAIELDEALEALLADVDEIARAAATDVSAARLLDSNSFNFSETTDVVSVFGNGVLLERQ